MIAERGTGMGSPSSNVTVVIGMMKFGTTMFIYEPAIETLVHGFRALGAQVLVGAGPSSLASKARLLGRGDLFIWIGMGSLFNDLPWSSLKRRGVRRVYYNTEDHVDRGFYTHLACRAKASMWAHVDEWWDYSWANLHACRHDAVFTSDDREDECRPSNQGVFRYVPPGFMESVAWPPTAGPPSPSPPPPPSPSPPDATAAVGASTAAAAAPLPHQVYFLGMVNMNGTAFSGSSRARCFAEVAATGALSTAVAMSSQRLRQLLHREESFLNLHKGCDVPVLPLEAFRLGPVLSSGGVVVSERSFGADEREYAGLEAVRFVDHADLAAAVRREAERPRDARLRAQRSAAFRARFDPVRLLRTAGIAERLGRAPRMDCGNETTATRV